MGNDLKFLKYLDNAVSYEKGKYNAIASTGTPFSFAKILDSVEAYDDEKLKTYGDVNARVLENKILKNTLIRRSYELFLREGFDCIDFNSLGSNSRYLDLKKKILKNDPDLMGVDDKDFLKQIANAIAHGNYISLFDLDIIEKELSTDNGEIVDWTSQNPYMYFRRQYRKIDGDAKAQDIIDKLNKHEKYVRVSPREMLLNILEGGMSKAENLHFKYESNYAFDGSGARVKRPSTVIYDLEISHADMDEILLFIISHIEGSKNIALASKGNPGISENSPTNTYRDDAEQLLALNDVAIFDAQNNCFETIQLDDKQREYFISEYIRDRELFDKDYYMGKYKAGLVADLLTTNATTQNMGLGDMLTNSKVNKLAYIRHSIDCKLPTYFNFVNTLYPQDKRKNIIDFVADEMHIAYSNKQIYNTYAECLISETLLLMQIIEDRGLTNLLNGNPVIQNFIDNLDEDVLNDLRVASKYAQDTMTIFHHLRNSLTHINYLQHSDNKLSIYDQVSKRNKNLVYKFDISINDLELIKNEFYSLVISHIPDANIDSQEMV